jgi:hypothetical protein
MWKYGRSNARRFGCRREDDWNDNDDDDDDDEDVIGANGQGAYHRRTSADLIVGRTFSRVFLLGVSDDNQQSVSELPANAYVILHTILHGRSSNPRMVETTHLYPCMHPHLLSSSFMYVHSP